jgi:hypothetical protein
MIVATEKTADAVTPELVRRNFCRDQAISALPFPAHVFHKGISFVAHL